MIKEEGKRPKPEFGDPLNEGEKIALGLVLSGLSAKEAAQVSCYSKRTIDGYIGIAYTKLGVSSRVLAYRKACEDGGRLWSELEDIVRPLLEEHEARTKRAETLPPLGSLATSKVAA
ncbi:MAG: LuxR C-terminal-related transcriptional regulator [bacterium]|nr:LuxR C-terminal-related transcriptional regulator [bacterium]